MKRSYINEIIRDAERFYTKHNFNLPPFAFWSLADWQKNRDQCREIFDCFLGWDTTDFGRGNFDREGLLLFTVRNGAIDNCNYSKPYAEKIMIVREQQLTLMHCHLQKTEDIINRGGGNLCFQLYSREGERGICKTGTVSFSQDGQRRTVPAGSVITLFPGESLTLQPEMFHSFWGQPDHGPVLVGEVSAVNDDHCDNVFYEPQLRFPEIEEDEEPYRLLVGDYTKFVL